ncbi:hypothetical protein SLEP1_g22663 [Rubroshorea leprosula]|uniref:Secreted protein n=1 Tax=Rubroshorea leprosula TaxID=152421 RepID=A0AAV5JKT3_9ROSI|nr:hypothetical protein SLEP1_g22663 [Rubroshorea leprosula]
MPWKTGEKAWFLAFFSCSRTQIEPRNSPPCWKIRICLALSAGCSCCGGKLLGFWISRELSSSMPSAFPQSAASVLAGELWYVTAF